VCILLDLQEALVAQDKRNKHTNYVSGKYCTHCIHVMLLILLSSVVSSTADLVRWIIFKKYVYVHIQLIYKICTMTK